MIEEPRQIDPQLVTKLEGFLPSRDHVEDARGKLPMQEEVRSI